MDDGAGKREQFTALYEDNLVALLGYARRRTDQPASAADVVAETFLTAWRRLDVVPAGDEARLWLYGVAHRVRFFDFGAPITIEAPADYEDRVPDPVG